MKLKTLLILIAITLGAAAYVHYAIEKPAEKKAEIDLKENGLVKEDLSLLETLEVKSATKPPIRLTQEENRWWIQTDSKDLASDTQVKTLINALKSFKKTGTIFENEEYEKKKANMAGFGLENPRLRVTYKTPGLKDPKTIVIGKENPGKTGVYAEFVGEKKLYLASKDFDFVENQNPNDYREMRILTVDSQDFVDVKVERQGESFKFEKNKEGLWDLVQKEKLPLDQEFLRNQINRIPLIRANEFFVARKIPCLKKPDVRLIVSFREGVSDKRTHDGDQRPAGVEIKLCKMLKPDAKKKNDPDSFDYFAQSDKTQPAAVARFHFDNFDKSLKSYIKKTFDEFANNDVQSIHVQNFGKSFSRVIRENGRLYVESGKEKKEAAPLPLDRAINALRSLKAEEFVSKDKFPEPSKNIAWSFDVETLDKRKIRYALQIENRFETLWYSNGTDSIKYRMPSKSLDGNMFEFKTLTTEPAPTPAEKPTDLNKKNPGAGL